LDVLAGGFERDVPVRELLAVHFGRGPADEEHVDRARHSAAAELRLRTSPHDLGFVRVVVQDPSVLIEIEAAEGPADRFGNSVRDRIRVSEALALDQLDLLVLDMHRAQRLHLDVTGHRGSLPSAEPGAGLTVTRR